MSHIVSTQVRCEYCHRIYLWSSPTSRCPRCFNLGYIGKKGNRRLTECNRRFKRGDI